MAKKTKDNLLKDSLKIEEYMSKSETHIKDGVLFFSPGTTIKQVALALKKQPAEIVKYFFMKKIMLNLNSPLNEEQVGELALNYDLDFTMIERVDETNVLNIILDDSSKKGNEDKRPPVVTIMGHVDHGKTTLLDSIRKTNVTKQEAGGITQSIGAYQIEYKKNKVTFIDTPGHEAFTKMRLRGSKITDIIVIVVAADDSVMPQTKESIDHALAANIPIIVAINKIDSPKANIKKVKLDVANHGLVGEEMGGDIPMIEISALKGDGIKKLLETIMLVGEVEDYKTKNKAQAIGSVVETHMEKGKGNVVTVLVQYGTLEKGDHVILDSETSNIKTMQDDKGNFITKALPSTPVKITGFQRAPELGAKFLAVHDIKEAKKIAKEKLSLKKNAKLQNNAMQRMETFLKNKSGSDSQKVLSVILKADSQGTIEALKGQVDKLSNDKVQVKIIRSDMGSISKADILLSEANQAPIYTFNLKTNSTTNESIKKHKIRVFTFDVIYSLLETLQKHMLGIQEVEYKKIDIGKAKVKQIFTFSKVGTIIGSGITEGKVTNKAKVKIFRDEEEIFDGSLETLRIEKDAVREVIGVGKEFAFTIKGYDDAKPGDLVEFYEMEEITYE